MINEIFEYDEWNDSALKKKVRENQIIHRQIVATINVKCPNKECKSHLTEPVDIILPDNANVPVICLICGFKGERVKGVE